MAWVWECNSYPELVEGWNDVKILSIVIKNISLVILFTVIGFAATLFIYLFLTKEHSQIIRPIQSTQFSLEKAPRESIIGNITSLSGQVLWTSRIADKPLPIKNLQPIQQGEELATEKLGKVTVEFPQALTITLAKNSDINIIQTLPANIIIQENQGNASFQKIGIIPISVRGLDFLINIDKGQSTISVDKDKSLVTIYVQNGLVTLAYTDTNNVSQVMQIKAGKTITFDNNTKTQSFL